VVFAGSGSLKPPSQAFNNPLVLSVQISEYGNFSEYCRQEVTQVSVVHRVRPVRRRVRRRQPFVFTPSGTICEGWKESNIPRNVSDPFNAFVEMVDESKKKYESTVYYSAKEELVIVSGEKKDGLVPFINETNVPDGVSVIHDFTKGYEYSLGSSPCLRPLPNDTADVISSEGTLSMRPLGDILIAPDLKFGNYGQLTDGRPTLSSYSRYSQTSSTRVSHYQQPIRACFIQSSQKQSDNNTFILEVKSKSVKDVYSQGYERVSFALANALSQIAPINPYRLRVFYDSGPDNSLRVFFSLDEKADVKPSTVPKYNFHGMLINLASSDKI
ncbi:hypothetical protein OSTOST_17145, partial [Ostertagia ostertagi]